MKIVNDNYSTVGEDRFLDLNVISMSEGVPSRDLKFQTEWRNKTRDIQRQSLTYGTGDYPLGYGMGNNSPEKFGNYTILAGTRLHANGTEDADKNYGMEEVFGSNWKDMTPGTPVRLQYPCPKWSHHR